MKYDISHYIRNQSHKNELRLEQIDPRLIIFKYAELFAFSTNNVHYVTQESRGMGMVLGELFPATTLHIPT